MLAIGNGAEQEILEQMKMLGANNIVITPIVEQKEGKVDNDANAKKAAKRFTPGLSYLDAEAIRATIPDVGSTSSEVVVNSVITREGHHRSGKIVGVDSSYFRVMNLRLDEGAPVRVARTSRQRRPVAIIGQGVKSRFFTTSDPIGQPIKVGNQWLTVVGVLEDRKVSQETAQRLGIRDANMDVYVPLPTMLLRYRNRAEVTQQEMELAARESNNGSSNDSTETDDAARREAQLPPARQDDRPGRQVDRRPGGGRGRAPNAAAPPQRCHRFRDHRARIAPAAGAAHEDDLQHRARRDRVDLARRRRHRDHEHHARVDPRAHQRDRRAPRRRRDAEATCARSSSAKRS